MRETSSTLVPSSTLAPYSYRIEEGARVDKGARVDDLVYCFCVSFYHVKRGVKSTHTAFRSAGEEVQFYAPFLQCC